jgi:hypothetical protein
VYVYDNNLFDTFDFRYNDTYESFFFADIFHFINYFKRKKTDCPNPKKGLISVLQLYLRVL